MHAVCTCTKIIIDYSQFWQKRAALYLLMLYLGAENVLFGSRDELKPDLRHELRFTKRAFRTDYTLNDTVLEKKMTLTGNVHQRP